MNWFITIYFIFSISCKIIKVGSGYAHKTIQSAIESASSGDTIQLASEIFYEEIIINKNDITIEGIDDTNLPIIDGADKNFVENGHTHVWENDPYEKNGENPIYKTTYSWHKSQPSYDDYNSYFGGWTAAEISAIQVYEDDEILRGYTERHDPDYPGGGHPYATNADLDPENDNGDLPADYIRPPINVASCNGRFRYDEGNSELYVWSSDGKHPSTHTYYIPVRFHLILGEGIFGITLRNMIIKHAEGYAVVFRDSSNITIENCFFISSQLDIFIDKTSNVRISNNFFQNEGFWKKYWYMDTKGTILWGSKIRVKGGALSRNIEIDHNSFHSAFSHITPYGEVIIHDNIFSHAISHHFEGGDYVDKCCTKRVYRNILHHVDDNSIVLSNVDPNVEPIYIYRNLFYACHSMIKDGGTLKEDSMFPAYLYHNTVVWGQYISHHPYKYPSYKTTVFKNNIFFIRYKLYETYWNYQDKDPLLDWSYFPFTNGIDSDYNIFHKKSASTSKSIGIFGLTSGPDRSYVEGEFEEMCSEQEIDQNSYEISPNFVNEEEIENVDVYEELNIDTFSNMDYREVISTGYSKLFKEAYKKIFTYFELSDNTTAKDNGVDIPSDWPDIYENGIIDGKPDIGAIEIGQTFFFDTSDDDDDELQDILTTIGVIVGVIVGVICVLLIIIGIIVYVFWKMKGQKRGESLIKSEIEIADKNLSSVALEKDDVKSEL